MADDNVVRGKFRSLDNPKIAAAYEEVREQTDVERDVAAVLADHWHHGIGPSGQNECACGYLLSPEDTWDDHVARVIREAGLLTSSRPAFPPDVLGEEFAAHADEAGEWAKATEDAGVESWDEGNPPEVCRHCGRPITRTEGIGGVLWSDDSQHLSAGCPKSRSHAHEPTFPPGGESRG